MLRLIILVVIILGCAKPTTYRPTVSLPELSEEITLQAREEFRQRMETYERVRRIADPLLIASSVFCKDRKREFGFYYFDRTAFDDEDLVFKNLFLDYYGLSDIGDYPFVSSVRQGSGSEIGGLRRADRIIRFNSLPVNPKYNPKYNKIKKRHRPPSGVGARPSVSARTTIEKKWLDTLADAVAKAPKYEKVPVEVARQDTTLELFILQEDLCATQVFPVEDAQANAYTDGETIAITTGMVRFASDEELALVIAHELAHCTEKHISKKTTNSLLGAFAGGLVDELLRQGLGIYTYGRYGNRGAQIGATAFSQAFELEADYVALYILARAGYSTENAADFWRKMAERSPLDSNSLTGTHPPTAQRYLLLSKTHAEIEKKKAEGLPLLPNRSGAEE